MADDAELRAARSHRARLIAGALLCAIAMALAAGGWAWASAADEAWTDNAYVRGDVTSMAPKVGGYVTAVEVDDNQHVRTEDVLFRIDDRDYRARVAQAEANVEAASARLNNVDAESRLQRALVHQAEAQLRAAEAERTLATKTADRRRELLRTNTVSQAQVDETEAGRARGEAAVAAASATLDAQRLKIAVLDTQREAGVAALAQARAARELAQIDLDNTVIKAPIDGVIGNRQVRVGRLVAPGAVLLDDVWLVANFKETRIEHIAPGQHARVTIDGFPNQVFDGVVDSLAPGSGSAFSLLPTYNATGNFVRVVQRVPVKIRLIGAPLPGRLVPGLSARVTIALRPSS
ncbi:HlyD family secretion protein [Rhodopseudomonas sp. NSM]|uniref:HlyD family secretion protein n=1 Tax=Rhodopseudomonas sp. NSM TaxID=3457630 RepID=UPI004036101B